MITWSEGIECPQHLEIPSREKNPQNLSTLPGGGYTGGWRGRCQDIIVFLIKGTNLWNAVVDKNAVA